MWDGPRQGPRGGPPFRGDHRGEMFGGRDGPMSDFRGRDGMNMGPMGSMGPKHLDLPPMDMRRMDGPPDMRRRDGDQHDFRGREPNRDFRPGEEPDFSLRRHYETTIRDKIMNNSGSVGPGRNADIGGRGSSSREPNRFMDMRDRDMFRGDMPRLNNPDVDGRRGFPMEPVGRNSRFRDMRDRPPMGMDDIDGCNMDMPERRGERRMTDFDRRGGPPFNPRGGFDSDMDFRNRSGPSSEFRGRDRSPLRFGNNNDGGPADRGRSDMARDFGGPKRPDFGSVEESLGDREFPSSLDSPPMDYRSGEEMTLAEEWKNRRKEKSFLTNINKDIVVLPEPNFSLGFGREGNLRDPLPFKDRDRPPMEFSGKDVGFPRREPFAPMDLPPPGHKGPQDLPFSPMGLLSSSLGRETEGKPWLGDRDPGRENDSKPWLGNRDPGRETDSKPWLGDRDPKHSQNTSNRDGKPLYHQEKNLLPQEMKGQNDRFKGPKDMPHDQGPEKRKMDMDTGFSSNTQQGRDQDYRDIDYRTGSGRVFDFKHEDFEIPAKALKESKPSSPSKFTDSGSQDQDYRSASVKDKVSNTISIIGIPKTATMEQILAAFAVRDGVPMQGMKIKSVVPGYRYDTAYVEFLNLEDAVHFMESNKGSLKLGMKTASMKYIEPGKIVGQTDEPERKAPLLHQPPAALLPSPGEPFSKPKSSPMEPKTKDPMDTQPLAPAQPLAQALVLAQPLAQDQSLAQDQWQRSSDLTPEAWQQQVDQQLQQQETEQMSESWANRNLPRQGSHQTDPIFKESKTMIIKYVKPTTTVETILKALDPYAYLDERNVRLVKGKLPGAKCFCFVDMDSHEQVTRLVELLTQPRPVTIDGVRVHAEVAKPLKNQRREGDKSSSLLGYPPDANMAEQYPPSLQYSLPLPPPTVGSLAAMHTDPMAAQMASNVNPALSSATSFNQGVGYVETPMVDPSYQAMAAQHAVETPMVAATGSETETYVYGSEVPDMTNYLYDATSGFYYDPQTTLYYDPSSRYFYNAQTQEYLYWDGVAKAYIPVPGGSSAEPQPTTMAADVQAILSNPAADAPLEMKKPSDTSPSKAPAPPQAPVQTPTPPEAPPPTVAVPASVPPAAAAEPETASTLPSEKREEEDAGKKDREGKEEKPRSLAAFKIMKDMERWAKIQNRQKDSVRSPSPVLKSSGQEERRTSKAADAGFAIFERKGGVGDDLFKKPLAPPKKEEKGKRPMGSLGLLASDYAAGSDEEVEEEKHEAPRTTKSPSEDKEDKLTDWKKMACLLCRRQFPNKDALIRHQQLSDLHKQNMEIHLKIKRSKKELEALENQEKELNAKEVTKSPPEPKRRKQQHQPQHHHNSWGGGGGGSREKVSERPGLGAEPVERKKKEHVVWDHATYKQAVRKAMFARFKELE